MRLLAAILLVLNAESIMSQPQYSITALRPDFNSPYDINDAGLVVGGGVLDLSTNTLQILPPVPGWLGAGAVAINESGVVVGNCHAPPPNEDRKRAAMWVNGQVTDLGSLGLSSRAEGVNDTGQVVGGTWLSFGQAAFLWENGVMTALPNLQTITPIGFAWDINNAGIVVGRSLASDNFGKAVKWVNGQISELSPGALSSEARAINSHGDIVGYADGRGTLWRHDGTVIDLGDFGGGSLANSYAYDINDLGQIVGYATDEAGHAFGFLWENGQMYKLEDLLPAGHGWRLTFASGVNNRGQIVSSGSVDATNRGFVMTPVPEPHTSIALALGLALAIGARRRVTET